MHRLLTGHNCQTAQQMGWGGIKNGDLLKAAENHFDIFITSDQNIRYQQNLSGRKIAIIELSTNKLRRIENASVLLTTTVAQIKPGDFIHVNVP
jgi:hypothetical protein